MPVRDPEKTCVVLASQRSSQNIMSLPTKAYLICTAPRSGSFLLAEGLQATRIAGEPQEYFDPVFEPFWRKRLQISCEQEFVSKILAAGTSANGVFGAKVLWFQLENLIARLDCRGASLKAQHRALSEVFSDLRYIFLVRRDKVAQAISYYKAAITDVWWMIDGHEQKAKTTPVFDVAQIEHHLRLISEYEKSWQDYFHSAGIQPYIVVYEDFVNAYEDTIREVLSFMDITAPANIALPAPRLKRQADAESQEWARRFREISVSDQPKSDAIEGRSIPLASETITVSVGNAPPPRP